MSAAWSGLLRLLGVALAGLYAIVPNYGLSIMLLTLVVNALLFPLTLQQMRSMRAMQAIQPEVKALREQWKDDRDRLNQETMALYKDAGVHPAAGCLPTLLQLPIWFALYRVLRNSVGVVPATSALHAALEAGRTSFLGVDLLVTPRAAWTDGALHALPYVVLVAAVMASSFTQQHRTLARLAASPSDQARMTQRLMKYYPILLGFFSWRMPAGLVLYWTTSQSVRIGQQFLLPRFAPPIDPTDAEAGSGSAAPAPSTQRSEPVPAPVRPHPRSKKRKRRRR